MEMTLEREFQEYVALHKYSVLKAIMMKYYADLQGTNTICIPDFLRDDTPEKLADNELRKLLLQDKTGQQINHLYNLAWDSVKEYLP